jgi:hypothetical protein
MAKQLVDLKVLVCRDVDTDLAILVRLDEDAKKVWLPRSEIEVEYERDSGTIATVTMPVWLAEEKDLI